MRRHVTGWGVFAVQVLKAIAPAAMLAASLMLGAPARAQTTANVTVTAGTGLATIPSTAFGLNTAVWGNLTDSRVPSLVYNAGVTALRYPGGSTSDTYNWQTNSIVPGQGGYANPANGFDVFMALANKVGATPVITVNYGSGPTGSGGGTPALAAAWVQYANVTKAYGVKYWEIGNEVYGNGEYGGAWETDLHAAHDPTTYGTNVAAFVTAMKAVDPTIKIGAVLAAPGSWPDGQAPDWNSNVLKQCGSVIDFVIVHWYPQNPGNESDAGLLAAPQSGNSDSLGVSAMMAKLKTLIATYGGANASKMQIFVTETNSVSSNPGKQTVSIVNPMFVADDVLSWLEGGAANVDVWAMQNGQTGGNASSSLYGTATYGDYGILSSGGGSEPPAETPMPTYYGIQMLSKLGHVGDTLVQATSSNSLLTVHAVKQANGSLALLLINKDPANSTTANVALAGYSPAATGTAYTYGQSSTAIGSASVSGIGTTFQVTAAPYSLTTVVLTPSGGAATPAYTVAASPASLSVAQGGSGSASIAVAPSGGFTGAVTFSVSGVPAGVTAAFSPASTTGATTLSFTVGSSVAAGTSVMTVTGTSGSLVATTTVALTVTATTPTPTPGFSLSDSPGSVALVQGSAASTTLKVTRSGGFTGPVTLAASGLPAGVTARFSPATTGSISMLTLTASGAAAAGTGSVTITGTSGGLSSTVTLPISITAQGGTGGGGSSSAVTMVGVAGINSPWFDEDDVKLTTTAPITAMTLIITAPSTNVRSNGVYNTVGGQIAENAASGAKLTFDFTLQGGQIIRPGTYLFAAQMCGDGRLHPATGDRWTITYTVGGTTFSKSGTFAASSGAVSRLAAVRTGNRR
jgi:hypothetical protein